MPLVDMNGLQKGVTGLVVVIVTIVLGTVLTSNLGSTTGLSTEAQLAATNGTSLLSGILTNWGDIIVLGLIVITVFIGILGALSYVANRGSR